MKWRSKHELLFGAWLDTMGCRMLAEHKFCPGRGWLLDFADPVSKVAVEIDGGEFRSGAHNRGARMARDYEKRNTAAAMGWAVFQLTGQMVQKDAKHWADVVARTVAARGSGCIEA